MVNVNQCVAFATVATVATVATPMKYSGEFSKIPNISYNIIKIIPICNIFIKIY